MKREMSKRREDKERKERQGFLSISHHLISSHLTPSHPISPQRGAGGTSRRKVT